MVCPYHQWIYALDGRLTNARLMGEGFDADEHRLRSAHIRELAGLIFVCLLPSEATPVFDPALEAIEPQLRPHGLERAKIVARDRYEVEANWKTVIENNRECYHCRLSHPEFCMSNYDLGLPGDARGDEEYDAALARVRTLARPRPRPMEVSFPDGAPYRVSWYPRPRGRRGGQGLRPRAGRRRVAGGLRPIRRRRLSWFTPVTSSPSRKILPLEGSIRRLIIFIVVVLPHPEGPTRTTISPP